MLRRWTLLLASLAVLIGSAAGTVTDAHAQGAPSVNVGGLMQAVGPASGLAAPRGFRNAAQSSNWSGYAATSGTYTSVSASWTEPTGVCHGTAFSSFWVGLDGFNSGSVEQTGTDVDCSGGSPRYYGWYEMFPAFPVNFSNTVRPGDHLSASVTYKGGNAFSLVLSDSTQGWSHTISASLAGAARSSAEVIAEAPSSSSGVLPLADFGKVNFSGSTANGSALGNGGGVTEIIMVDSSGQDKDTVSSLSGGTSFSATWQRSN